VHSDLTTRQRNTFVTILAVNSGFIDVVGFIALGGAFASVMTGNMVLLGLSTGASDSSLAAYAALAIVCFITGCAVATRIGGVHREGDPVWPAAVSRTLLVELVLLAVFAIGWWASSSHPDGKVQFFLLGLNATALGVQSSAVQRFGVSGLTTYLTGTLIQLVIRLTSGHSIRHVAHSGSLLLGLSAGAALGGLLSRQLMWALPIVPIVLQSTVVLGPMIVRRITPAVAAG